MENNVVIKHKSKLVLALKAGLVGNVTEERITKFKVSIASFKDDRNVSLTRIKDIIESMIELKEVINEQIKEETEKEKKAKEEAKAEKITGVAGQAIKRTVNKSKKTLYTYQLEKLNYGMARYLGFFSKDLDNLLASGLIDDLDYLKIHIMQANITAKKYSNRAMQEEDFAQYQGMMYNHDYFVENILGLLNPPDQHYAEMLWRQYSAITEAKVNLFPLKQIRKMQRIYDEALEFGGNNETRHLPIPIYALNPLEITAEQKRQDLVAFLTMKNAKFKKTCESEFLDATCQQQMLESVRNRLKNLFKDFNLNAENLPDSFIDPIWKFIYDTKLIAHRNLNKEEQLGTEGDITTDRLNKMNEVIRLTAIDSSFDQIISELRNQGAQLPPRIILSSKNWFVNNLDKEETATTLKQHLKSGYFNNKQIDVELSNVAPLGTIFTNTEIEHMNYLNVLYDKLSEDEKKLNSEVQNEIIQKAQNRALNEFSLLAVGKLGSDIAEQYVHYLVLPDGPEKEELEQELKTAGVNFKKVLPVTLCPKYAEYLTTFDLGKKEEIETEFSEYKVDLKATNYSDLVKLETLLTYWEISDTAKMHIRKEHEMASNAMSMSVGLGLQGKEGFNQSLIEVINTTIPGFTDLPEDIKDMFCDVVIETPEAYTIAATPLIPEANKNQIINDYQEFKEISSEVVGPQNKKQ